MESFTKYRERIKKFREIGNLKRLYRTELDKVCFAHDATHSDSEYLAKRAYCILQNISQNLLWNISQSRIYCIWTSLNVLKRIEDTSLGQFVQK